MRTDQLDGFLLDRGFQVFLDAYPEAGDLLDKDSGCDPETIMKLPMPSTFQASTPLRASVETMFEFHSNPRNLPEVMPPTLKLVSLKTDGPAQEGRMIELHCRDWWIIPMHWTCRWKTVQAPDLLVDEIVEGPFTLFIHEHRFERRGSDECIMHDTVTYQWGRSWWGRLVSETGVRVYLKLLFKYRHHRTRKWAMLA